mgnify:CR=1 FL=1
MLSNVKSCGLSGIDGYVVTVETDMGNGLPAFEIVGLADTAVRESKERVRSAIKNTGLEFPIRRITVNLAPASIRKEGAIYDLPIALGILISSGQLPVNSEELNDCMFIGELSLGGDIKAVQGVLPMAVCAFNSGVRNMVVPLANADEAGVVKGLNVLPAENIIDVIKHITGHSRIKTHSVDLEEIFSGSREYDVDFADVKGQESTKRALEIAASGSHNCLLIGSPGSGKTMLARRIPTILPEMTLPEALEVTKVHSIAGILPSGVPLLTARPFRSPHHTVSAVALVGGGKYLRPGEISLAHNGVLFLDELPEFGRDALEVLRQPLEDGCVTISRISSSMTYPAIITLICAANPCKCGKYLEPGNQCSCSPLQVEQYLGKLSKPLLDRIDIQIEVSSVKYRDLEGKKDGESSWEIRKRVNRARSIQIERYKEYGIYSNSGLQPGMIKKFCKLDDKGNNLLRNAFERLGLSARAHNRILKVSRTIADMDGSDEIKAQHVAEAIQYRSLDRRFWRG